MAMIHDQRTKGVAQLASEARTEGPGGGRRPWAAPRVVTIGGTGTGDGITPGATEGVTGTGHTINTDTFSTYVSAS